MDSQILYVKFNKERKREYALMTEVVKRGSTLYVRKVAKKEAEEFLSTFVKKYNKLSKIKTSLKIVKAKKINSCTIEFPYIHGVSLLQKLSNIHNQEIFLNEIKKYVDLIDSLPKSRKYLDKRFFNTFGEFQKEKKYEVIDSGLLDISFENLLEDKNGLLHLIDYEWTFDFPIPRDYILFRSFLYLITNISYNTCVNFQELIGRYLNNPSIAKECVSWELNFQRAVSQKHVEKLDAFENLNGENDSIQKKRELDIPNLLKENDVLKQEIIILKNNLNTINNQLKALNTSDFVHKISEYESFKQTKIWEALTIYRKFKKYFKNFFINIFRDGPILTFKRIFKRIGHVVQYRTGLRREANPYNYWVKQNRITQKRRKQIMSEIKAFQYKPLISIVMPVYNVDIKWIKEAIKSIKKQIYTNWELCIADDASTKPELKQYLERISKEDKVNVVFRKRNGHISLASNSALKSAKGEFVALMDNDDIIHPHALYEIVKVLNNNRRADLIYSDEDKIDIKGKRMEPFFKPDWSPDLFMSTNYLCHLTVIRKKLIDDVKGFRKGYEGSQDYDLFLRIIEKTNNIVHIPDVLYSWRKIPGSTAAVYNNKGYADKASLNALKDAIKRRNINAEVTKGLFPGSFRVKYKIEGEPLVSIIIPTKDNLKYIEKCISSILEKTTYKNYEIIIIDTNSTEKETLDYYKKIEDNPKIRILTWKKSFNYSSVNNYGVRNARGKYILLLNNDTEIITPTWIEGMLEHAQRKEIGAVGVKLLYPNDTIQHVGVVLGIAGPSKKESIAGHIMRSFPKDIMGIPFTKDIIRNYSAVTAACLMINKEKYLKMNGMDEKYRIAFNDIDFGIRLYKYGYYNLYTPYVELYHYESASVGTPNDGTRDMTEFAKEVKMMKKKWGKTIYRDPFYNKNLKWENTNSEINTKFK